MITNADVATFSSAALLAHQFNHDTNFISNSYTSQILGDVLQSDEIILGYSGNKRSQDFDKNENPKAKPAPVDSW